MINSKKKLAVLLIVYLRDYILDVNTKKAFRVNDTDFTGTARPLFHFNQFYWGSW